MIGAGRARNWDPARIGLVLLATAACVCVPSDASAQARVRVLRDQTTVWRLGFLTIATVASAGTEFDVVTRQGDWYEVLLTPDSGGATRTGFIAAGQVEALDADASGLPGPPAGSDATGPPRMPSPSARSDDAGAGGPRRASVRAFGHVGVGRFAAADTFDLVTGTATGLWWGGGVSYVMTSGAFLQVAVEHYRAPGERAFAFDGEVFPLGIDNVTTIIPIELTVGYRRTRGRVVSYLGGGLATYLLREESEFSEPSDNVRDHAWVYHALGGFEWRLAGFAGAAVEGVYAIAPDGLRGGLADAFDEHDLGGLKVRVKVVIGR